MERLGVLINKLKEQLADKADVQNMLVTVQMLQTELLSKARESVTVSNSKVSVIVPTSRNFINIDTRIEQETYKPVPKPTQEPEPLSEPFPEEEQPIPEDPQPTPKPEPEPIPHFVQGKPWEDEFLKKENNEHWTIDPMLEFPTLAHQEKIVYELNDSMMTEDSSLNTKLKEDKKEMGSVLQDTPIRDLKKAVSINDRHQFISELFRGDETMYERSIKTINGFSIYAEAEYWIQRELKVKLGWNTTLEIVKTFDQLVKRRFT